MSPVYKIGYVDLLMYYFDPLMMVRCGSKHSVRHYNVNIQGRILCVSLVECCKSVTNNARNERCKAFLFNVLLMPRLKCVELYLQCRVRGLWQGFFNPLAVVSLYEI